MNAGLDVVFVATRLQCNLLLRGLLLFIERPGVWAPTAGAARLRPCLADRVSILHFCALVSGNPVPWMSAQAVFLGSWRVPVGIVAFGAYVCDMHVPLLWCRIGSVCVAAAGIPVWPTDAGAIWAALAVGAAWWHPAFPDAIPPPLAPHPEPPPADRGLRVTSWSVYVFTSRRNCYCHVDPCKGPMRRGDLRAFSATLAHEFYYRPECVEGGLAPYDSVVGTDQLTDAQKDAVRDLCDQPWRTAGAQFFADVRSAKRVRQQGSDGGGAPLQGKDDGDLGDLPED